MSVIVVAYHAVATPASPVTTPLEQLESDLTRLGRAGFSFVSLDEVAAWIAGRLELPGRAAAITFDDAYESVVTLALPLLNRLKVPATVFAIAGRLGGDNQWPGQWKSIPSMRLADLSGIRALVAGGLSIGCHSWSHPSLPVVSDADLHREVVEAGDHLEQLTGMPVRHFAYPYGHRGGREMAAVAARYDAAVSTYADVLRRAGAPADLPRIDCHDLRLALRLRVASPPAFGPYLAARRALRTVRRTVERPFHA